MERKEVVAIQKVTILLVLVLAGIVSAQLVTNIEVIEETVSINGSDGRAIDELILFENGSVETVQDMDSDAALSSENDSELHDEDLTFVASVVLNETETSENVSVNEQMSDVRVTVDENVTIIEEIDVPASAPYVEDALDNLVE